MRDQRVENILESSELTPRTDRTITDPAVLRDQLEEVCERGYAIDDEETVPGIRCVAVPVVIGDPEVLGAVSVSGPTSRMTEEHVSERISEQVLGAANVIEVNARMS
jgi:DNA-binding IclR family transcriptional regulator